ncbi:PAS domain-containing sensor histidine kinase [Spirosoma jeollabukense]
MASDPQSPQALKDSEERFQAAIRAVQGILWTNDATGQMIGPQPGWATLTGQREDEYRGYGWAKAVHPNDAQPTIDAWEKAVAERRMFAFEHRLRLADGSWGLFSIRAIPLLAPDGSIREWVGVHTNVTQQRQAEQALIESKEAYRLLSANLDQQVQERTAELETANQELAKANQRLRQSNESLQAFAYVASHDLQEPLRKIRAFGDLLKNEYAVQLGEGVSYLERMQSAAGRLTVLIKDLLNLSRLSAQRTTLEPVSVLDVVNQVLTDLDLMIEERQADIQLDPLPVVMGDARQLGQLFQNLLGNALKFHQPNTPPRIRLSTQEIPASDLPASVELSGAAQSYYRIDVSDNGIGFEEKYKDQIFQVFHRLNGSSQYEGTGIGLAICQQVAVHHGSAIVASSQPGQGSTFSVYLPQPY